MRHFVEYEELAPARTRKLVWRSCRDERFQRDPWNDPKGARHHAYESFLHGYEMPEVVRMQHQANVGRLRRRRKFEN